MKKNYQNYLAKPFFMTALFTVGLLTNLFSQYDENVQEFARCVSAMSNQDVEFRNYIKTAMLQQTTGDYELIVKDHLNHRFADGSTFQQKMVASAISSEELTQFINSTPRMQISMPVLCEEWNTEIAPPTAFIGENYNETDEFVQGFDSRGNLISIDAQKEPNYPVLVVGLCERIDDDGRLLEFFGGSVSSGGGEPGGGDPPSGGSSCNGPDGAWEYVNSLKVSNMGAIEGWLLGKPEIRVVARTFSDQQLGGQNGKLLVPNKRKNINNKWYTFNATMFRWYNQNPGVPNVGNACIFYLTEYDGGLLFQIPITIVIPPVSISITVPIANHDEIIGDQVVYFEDCNYFEYNLGSVQMKLKRQ